MTRIMARAADLLAICSSLNAFSEAGGLGLGDYRPWFSLSYVADAVGFSRRAEEPAKRALCSIEREDRFALTVAERYAEAEARIRRDLECWQ